MLTNRSMEALNTLASNGLYSLGAIIIIILIFIISIRKGWISFKGHGLSIGQDQLTRNLIQSQLEYANAKIEGMIAILPDNLDIYHTKYILGRVEDVVEKAIIFNNMSDKESYIKSKQELVYQTIMKRITNNWFKTPEFKELVYKFTRELFEELYRMKKDA